ncbi:MAG: allantoinase [Paraglaciecola psychrophila]|jgi:allantoinase
MTNKTPPTVADQTLTTASLFKSERVLIDGIFQPACLVVSNGIITAIEALDFELVEAQTVQDFGKRTLIPGLVDTHVHINEPGRTEWEGFNTATRAAAAGGISTVVDMPLNCTPVTTSADALQQKLTALEGKLWIDCGFWGGVVPDSLDGLPALIEAGVLGVKSFTIDSGIDDFQPVGPSHLSAAIDILAQYNIPYLIHAELDSGLDAPDIGNRYQSFLASRPKSWENDAIEMMIDLAEQAHSKGVNGKIHIVHLSSAEAIPAIRAAQDRGLQLSAETCPHYLSLFAESIPDGKTLFKCCPPIREDANRQQLWQGLAEGTIEFIVSDHSPCTPQLKHIDSGDIEKAWGGISSLQFGLSIIWTEAKERGYSLQQVIDWMATRPARFAGLGHKKGRIAVGFDADLVVFDETAEYTISAEMIQFRHKITPYEGKQVAGRVEQTFVRGHEVYAFGAFPGQPQGQPLMGEAANNAVAKAANTATSTGN